MKVFVSDLHLGDGQQSDYFTKNKVTFLSFLNYLCANKEVKELIFLGDLLFLSKTNIFSIFSQGDYENLFEKLKKAPFSLKYIIGNHDYHMLSIKKQSIIKFANPLFKNIEATYQNDLVHAEHGSQLDPFCYREDINDPSKTSLADLAFYLSGYLEKNFHPDIENRLLLQKSKTANELLTWITRRFNLPNKVLAKIGFSIFIKAMALEKNKLAANFGLQNKKFSIEDYIKENHIEQPIIIFGHFHQPFLKQISTNQIFINSGSWIKRTALSSKYTSSNSFITVFSNLVRLNRWGKKNEVSQLGEARKINEKWQVTIPYNEKWDQPREL